jgi:predicted ATPase/class 3 adenylate cyclase/DNA-binding CsgD family transcriptional regulator
VTVQRPAEGAVELPAGTVTLLLADVEGSTRLWEADADVMAAAVDRLDGLVAEIVGRHRGVRPVEQGEGDSFVVAFTRASDAVSCALDLQRAGTAPIRMRVGIHTGEAQLRGDGNYVGTAIARCARLRDLAHGAQTVLSATTANLMMDRLPAGAWLKDLGVHRLRDLGRPERVYQLCYPDLAVDHPPLRSPDVYEHNLPVQLTSFVGRRAELAEVAALIGEARLVTLTGSGGAGKTRLAVQLAAENLAGFPDGVWLAELAPISDPNLVGTAVSTALGLRDEPFVSASDALVRHLGDKQSLLVIDNCEHLIGACADLVETLLRACPSLSILATSREPLGVVGEVTWRVPPLTLPADAGATDVLEGSEAVVLFRDRARLVRPGFEINAGNAAAVADIVRRLDGIPLAIELAAARIKAFSPTQISSMLHDRFNLLTGGARTAVPRQQTLRASVEWSHELLSAPERVLFRRLAVFPAGFDLAAAEAVGQGGELAAREVIDQLALLVDKSLVLAEGDEHRYRLLETVRQLADERLDEAGEGAAARRRHRDHYLAFVEHANRAACSPDHEHWVDRLDAELDNTRAAFWWSMHRGDADEALRLATASYFLWYERARSGEGMAWLIGALSNRAGVPVATQIEGLSVGSIIGGTAFEGDPLGWSTEAVALARESGDAAALMLALFGGGGARVFLGDDSAVPYFSEALEIARANQEPWLTAHILLGLSLVEMTLGDPRARALALEGRDAAARAGWGWAFSGNSFVLGFALAGQGDLAESRTLLEQTLDERRPGWGTRWAIESFLGFTLILLGDTDAGVRYGEQAVATAREQSPFFEFLGNGVVGAAHLAAGAVDEACVALRRAAAVRTGVGRMFTALLASAELAAGHMDLARAAATKAMEAVDDRRASWMDGLALMSGARVALADGCPDEAERLVHRALAARERVGDKAGVAESLELIAALAADQQSDAEAVRLLAAATALADRIGYRRPRLYDDAHASLVDSLRVAMGDEPFGAAWAEGASLSAPEAVAYARRGRGERRRPSAGWASLTPSERSVVALVAEGLSNKQIAERLFISPRTVQTHLTHVYTKLGISTRVELVRQAARHADDRAG